MRQTRLPRSDFSQATLREGDLARADLLQAAFEEADLEETNLRRMAIHIFVTLVIYIYMILGRHYTCAFRGR